MVQLPHVVRHVVSRIEKQQHVIEFVALVDQLLIAEILNSRSVPAAREVSEVDIVPSFTKVQLGQGRQVFILADLQGLREAVAEYADAAARRSVVCVQPHPILGKFDQLSGNVSLGVGTKSAAVAGNVVLEAHLAHGIGVLKLLQPRHDGRIVWQPADEVSPVQEQLDHHDRHRHTTKN